MRGLVQLTRETIHRRLVRANDTVPERDILYDERQLKLGCERRSPSSEPVTALGILD